MTPSHSQPESTATSGGEPSAASLVSDLRSPSHRQPVNPKANYRTRDIQLFEDAAACIERLSAANNRPALLLDLVSAAQPLVAEISEYAPSAGEDDDELVLVRLGDLKALRAALAKALGADPKAGA